MSECVLGVSHSLSGRRWVWRGGEDRIGLGIAQRLGLPLLLGYIVATFTPAALWNPGTDDRAKIRELWSSFDKAWWDSADDPDIRLLVVEAYEWAFLKPIRKLYYNLIITMVAVVIAVLIGGIETLGLLKDQLHLEGGFWSFVDMLNGK